MSIDPFDDDDGRCLVLVHQDEQRRVRPPSPTSQVTDRWFTETLSVQPETSRSTAPIGGGTCFAADSAVRVPDQ